MRRTRRPTPLESTMTALAICAAVFVGGGIAVHAVTFLIAAGAAGQEAFDRRTGKAMVLAARVECTSPDGRLRCVAETDGTLQIVDAAGKVLHQTRLSPKEYTSVRFEWIEPQRIKIIAGLRYGVMSNHTEVMWDVAADALHPWRPGDDRPRPTP